MSKQRAKGTAFETLLLPELRTVWPYADRASLHGRDDTGDFYLASRLCAIEAKNRATLDLAGWVGEAEVEAANAGAKVGVVIHKRRGKGAAGDQYVTMTVRSFLVLAQLAERA